MGQYIVEIRNSDSQSFKISLSAPRWNGYSTGSWQTIDKGSICYNSGATKYFHSVGTLASKHIFLYSSENTWGNQIK